MKLPVFLCLVLLASLPLAAQNPTQSTAAKPQENYSGMYSFLREGEFVQLNLEDDGSVTGFVSRYGDSDSDRGAFLDQFFKQAKLDGNKLTFTTDIVHGVWYEFKGTVERGDGKFPSEEGYYVLRGTLTDNRTNAEQKVAVKSQQATFKSFPKDREAAPPK